MADQVGGEAVKEELEAKGEGEREEEGEGEGDGEGECEGDGENDRDELRGRDEPADDDQTGNKGGEDSNRCRSPCVCPNMRGGEGECACCRHIRRRPAPCGLQVQHCSPLRIVCLVRTARAPPACQHERGEPSCARRAALAAHDPLASAACCYS